MASGVKVVGGSNAGSKAGSNAGSNGPATVGTAKEERPVDAPRVDDGPAAEGESDDRRPAAGAGRTTQARRAPRRRRAGVVALAVVALLGVAGTVGFGLAWKGLQDEQSGEAQARTAARTFLVDLTNFNAKTVDADFAAVSSMATGPFAAQAQKFFNSSIRQDLQKALASSRGQIRALDVQRYAGGSAAVYGVVDQLYVNDKLTSPQTDVLRMVVDLSQVGGRWKVADVTVLQGPSLGPTPSSGTGSGG